MTPGAVELAHAEDLELHADDVTRFNLATRANGRMVILDTKFTANSLIHGRWGNYVFDSSHLYQLYAYLRSQEHVSEFHRCALGILLYPTVHENISEIVELQGHQIRFVTVNLFTALGKN